MSTPINDGGPALPVVKDQYDYGYEREMPKSLAPGMTLRDYFAAKVMAALLTRVDVVTGDYVTNATPEQGAESAYRWADAMLKAREA